MELYGALMQSYLYGGIVPVALLLLVVVLLAVLRKRRAVCWFCHEPQPAGWEEGGWNCVSCRQYNGFTEDGSYDKEMTEHAAVDNLSRRYCTAGPSDLAPPPADILCSQCEQNLQLKVAQLASFQPTSEACFEEEATEYEQSVEKLYPLCASCEQKVANELSRRDHMIKPLLLNTKRTSLQKRKTSLSKQKCSWICTLLQLTSIAMSLWSLVSLVHCQQNPCQLFHHYCGCGPSSYKLHVGSSRRLCSPRDTASLLRPPVTRSTPGLIGAAVDMSHDFSHDQTNGTCWTRRTIDQFCDYVIKPKEYWHVKICCRVFIGLCWLTGLASSSQSRVIAALSLMVLDTALSINRKQRKLHLGLLLLDTAVLCLLPQVCFQLPFRITRCEALSSSRLGGMVAVVSTALRILDPLVGHCSSRKQQSKHALRGLKKRREERVRAEPESSPQAIQNSLSGLSIGRAANGSGQKSWLRTLEEMNLLSPVPPGNCDATSCAQQISNGDSIFKSNGTSVTSLNTSPTGLFTDTNIAKPHPPDGRKKPLLRPARLRYRRLSISSATAALSLGNSNPWSGGLEQELLLSLTPPKAPPAASLLNSGLNCASMAEGGPPRFSETQTTVATAVASKEPADRRKAGRRCPRVMTALLVASVASNVLLLAFLLLHMNTPDMYRQNTRGLEDGHM